MIVIYNTPTCPRCKLISSKLTEWGIPREEKDMNEASSEERTECILDIGYWPQSAPVVRIGEGETARWYADISLFPSGKLDEKKLRAIL
jgi:glutaredoxin